MRRIEFTVNEQQLTRLIKQMVREAKDEMEVDIDLDMKRRGGRFDILEAVKNAAKIFEREFAVDMSDEDLEELEDSSSRININRAINKLESKSGDEGSSKEEMATDKIEDLLGSKKDKFEPNLSISEGLYESYLTEDKFDRVKSIIARANMFGGLAILGLGGLSFVSMIPGYVDFQFLLKVHEMVETTGCSRYCGPLSFFIACLGVAMFFHGMVRKDSMEPEKPRRGGDLDERYYY
jgi:hypothetical protein